MDLGPLEGVAKLASIHDRHPVGEPRHSVQYCKGCNRSFGIDTVASYCCGEMRAVSGTLEEVQRFIALLKADPELCRILEGQQDLIRSLEQQLKERDARD
jgi:hypothetical protein